MATLNQKLALNNKLHKALYKNVCLLNLYYPISKELEAQHKEGILEKPNSAGFHHLSYYLMSIILASTSSTSSSWAMFEIRMEAKYRSEFLKFVNKTSEEHPGHISRIAPSWIVNAGGTKVTKLLFELSQVALKVHLTRRNTQHNLDITGYKVENGATLSQETMEHTIKRMSQWRAYTCNMNKIAQIYLRQIPIIEEEKEKQQEVLKSLVMSLPQWRNGDIGAELLDIFTPSSFLQIWEKDIDKQIRELKEKWEMQCVSLVNKTKVCKNRSEQLIQMHLNKCNKDFVLEYNPNCDGFNISSANDNDLPVSQHAVLRSTVRDGVLHLPNLFKSYTIIISYCFDNYIPCYSSQYLESLLNEKKNILMLVKQKSKDLVSEVFKFHNELKEGLENQDTSYVTSESASGILDALNIPSFSVQPPTYVNHVEFWQKSLEKYKFTKFEHPFKSEKKYYVTEKEPSIHNASKIYNSVIKKGFFSVSKEPQISRKIDSKPEYLKNIEELEKNMYKIADVANKTFAPQHNLTINRNATAMRRQSLFSQYHMKYLLTSIKKKSSIPDTSDQSCRVFRKTRGNLFNETIENTSLLQKTQSSPNLALDDASEIKSRLRIDRSNERISGVKEIDYSSFISDLGSMPNLYNASDKENVPQNCQAVITETILIDSKIEITHKPDDTTPKENVSSPTKKKDLGSIIDTYRKFKESRGLGTKSNDNNVTSNSKNLADSFLEKLDLGDSKNTNKRVIKECDVPGLSTVPDLLSPSLAFNSQSVNSDT